MESTMQPTDKESEPRSEKYTYKELESFVNGIDAISKKMREVYEGVAVKTVRGGEKIDSPYYLVNLHGSLPLFDALTIVDHNLDTDRAVYFPGSSRIQRSRDVMRNCFDNFFWEKRDEGRDTTPILSIDEIVGGHSVERVINAYNTALRTVARRDLVGTERRKNDIEDVAQEIKEQFPLFIFGLKDTRDHRRKTNRKYQQLSNPNNPDKMIYEFPVDRIITMDDLDYQVLEFQHPDSNGWSPGGGYYPKIAQFTEKRPYLELLHDIARFIGADPEMVDISRARVMSDCERYSKKPSHD